MEIFQCKTNFYGRVERTILLTKAKIAEAVLAYRKDLNVHLFIFRNNLFLNL
jgi:hypothetical protein